MVNSSKSSKLLCSLMLPILGSLGVSLAISQRLVADEPLPSGDEVYTQAQREADILAYDLRILKTYAQHTQDPVELHAAAQKILKHDRQCERTPGQLSKRAENYQPGQDLLKQGSNDPLILMATGAAAYHSKANWQVTLDLMQRAEKALEGSTYPAHEQALVRTVAWVYHDALRREIHGRAWREHPVDSLPAMKAVLEWFDEEGDDASLDRILFPIVERMIFYPSPASRVAGALSPLPHQEFLELIKSERAEDTWIANVLLGKDLFRTGQTFLLQNKKNEGGRYLVLSAEQFVLAWERNPHSPETTVDLITLSRTGHSGRSPRFWFDQCVAALFDYKPAYTNFRMSLRPGWGGSLEALYAFGRECLKTERFDTEVPLELMQDLYVIDAFIGEQGEVWGKGEFFDDVFQMYEGVLGAKLYEGKPHTEETRQRIRSYQIALGVRAKKHKAVAHLWDKSEDKMIRGAFFKFKVNSRLAIERALGEAVIELGSDAYELEALLPTIDQVDSQQAARVILDRIENSPLKGRLAWLEYARAMLEQNESYAAGDWVEVTFIKELPEFLDANQWTVESPDTIQITGWQPLVVPWLNRLQPPLEVMVELEMKDIPPEVVLGGLHLGIEDPQGGPSGLLFGVNSATGEAGTRRVRDARMLPAHTSKVNHVHIQAWEGHYRFNVNARPVLEEKDELFTPANAFALWTPSPANLQPFTRFSKLRVRRIPCAAPPAKKDFAARIKYFTERIEEDPKSHLAYHERAMAYQATGKLDLASEDFTAALKLQPEWTDVGLKLGEVLTGLGKTDEARQAYLSIIKTYPRDRSVLNRLAWLQATSADEELFDAQAAVANAKQLVERNPAELGFLKTLIAAHLSAEDYDAAQKVFQQRSQHPLGDEKQLLQQLADCIQEQRPYRPK